MTTKEQRTEIFKSFQQQIKKESTFETGKQDLLKLREELLAVYDFIFDNCELEDFSKIPLRTDKTIAYYLYHLLRIEDMTSNTLIKGTTQIFFADGFDKKLNSPIITTGNELHRDELVEFSKTLNIDELKKYAHTVIKNTNKIISEMDFAKSKTKISEEKKASLINLRTVSTAETAGWLVGYWCNKTYTGLFLMPHSRHHMLHLNGCLRIMDALGRADYKRS